MPLLGLYELEKEGDSPRKLCHFSFESGETFGGFREKLVLTQMIKYPFDFWDPNMNSHMPLVVERWNKIEDYNNSITVVPKFGSIHDTNSSNPMSQSQVEPHIAPDVEASWLGDDLVRSSPKQPPTLGSSDASNQVSVGTGDTSNSAMPSQSEGLCPSDFNDVEFRTSPTAENPIERLSNESKLMPEECLKEWKKLISRVEKALSLTKFGDHRWRVVLWDADDEPQGKIVCEECDSTINGRSKGVMDKTSIGQCFGNFRNKHLSTVKHFQHYCNRRKLPIPEVNGSRKKAEFLSPKELVTIGIQTIEDINIEVGGPKKCFLVIGDLERHIEFTHYYRAQCTYCNGAFFFVVPSRSNLEHNLREHLAGPKHIAAVQDSKGKIHDRPLLTGRAGRPEKFDKRDVRQRTMQAYFGHDQGRPGQSFEGQLSESGGSKGMNDQQLALSKLCWGFWRNAIPSSSGPRYVKAILGDQLRGSTWWCEPYILVVIIDLISGEKQNIKGLFRHVGCARVSRLGGGFLDLTCEACHSIPLQTDFRLRVLREAHADEKRGTRDTGMGRRLDYLTCHELRSCARKYNGCVIRERKRSRRYLARICMLQTKVPSLREIVGEAVNRKDVQRFCSSIVSAHRDGAFGGKSAIWDMLKDIVFNLNRNKHGRRYSKGTRIISQALFMHGGRRVVDCLSQNMLGPSIETLLRDRRGMTHFRPGLHETQFKLIARVYVQFKQRLGITGDLPCILAEDETTIKQSVRWVTRDDALVGFCGPKTDHSCQEGLEIVVGNGTEGFEKIMTAFSDNCLGGLARVIVVNPLHAEFPRLVIFATSTCNRFKHDWVRKQWNSIVSMWNIHCRQQVGPILGHASDGDSRRRKLMLEDYNGKSQTCKRQGIHWDGWMYSHSITNVGDAYGLHDQDYIHGLKKLINVLDSPVKVMHVGNAIVTLEHVQVVYSVYKIEDHGLQHEDVLRSDRQNWASAQRLCSRKVIECLRLIRDRDDGKIEMTMGTETYLSICSDYVDIFLNPRLSLRTRVVHCARVSFFFRFWRLWLLHGLHEIGGNRQPLNLGNTISTQTFNDIQMSVHFIVLLIVLFRDKYPMLPIPFHLTGSDSCEQFFSKVGGMKGHERNYDFMELIDCASSLNRLAELELFDGLVSVGKSHKKHKNIWMKLHPMLEGENAADLTDYSGVFSNDQVIEALKEGCQEAKELCSKLQMCPMTSSQDQRWWQTPWLVEKETSLSDSVTDVPSDFQDDVTELELVNDLVDAPSYMPGENMEEVLLAEWTNPDILFSDDIDDEQVAIGELQHVCQDLVGEVEEDMGVAFMVAPRNIDATVQYDGRRIYKSTLVSQLTENPFLSKDRLTKVKQSVYFNTSLDRKPVVPGVPTMFMGIGSDCGVLFVREQTRTRTRATFHGKGRKRLKPSALASSSTDEIREWFIGRVQKVRRKYGNKWGRSREPVDLLDRPDDSSPCAILFNWFTQNSKLMFTYDQVDPQWIELESVISTVTLTVNLRKTNVFTLDTHDASVLDDFVKNST